MWEGPASDRVRPPASLPRSATRHTMKTQLGPGQPGGLVPKPCRAAVTQDEAELQARGVTSVDPSSESSCRALAVFPPAQSPVCLNPVVTLPRNSQAAVEASQVRGQRQAGSRLHAESHFKFLREPCVSSERENCGHGARPSAGAGPCFPGARRAVHVLGVPHFSCSASPCHHPPSSFPAGQMAPNRQDPGAGLP